MAGDPAIRYQTVVAGLASAKTLREPVVTRISVNNLYYCK